MCLVYSGSSPLALEAVLRVVEWVLLKFFFSPGAFVQGHCLAFEKAT